MKFLPFELMADLFQKEQFRVIRYQRQISTAQQLLANDSSMKVERGLILISELSHAYPHLNQMTIDVITGFIRTSFNRTASNNRYTGETLSIAVRLLTSIQRCDPNGMPFHFDLCKIRISDADLSRANFDYFFLAGCHFSNVILSHASFVNADLGGVLFENCNLEYANVANAAIHVRSGKDARPTRILGTRLRGINLEKADLEYCELQNLDGISIENLDKKIADNKIRILDSCFG